MKKVFIDGREGTTGLKIFERFSTRDDLQILTLPDDKRKDPKYRREFINQSDITFLCLPDAAAMESASLCENNDTVIIDASTAHRTNENWNYGFPELSISHRIGIQNGKRIAVPGCHASGFVSLVYPLRALGILPPDYPIVCYSLTGYSGGGKKMIADYQSDNRDIALSSPRQYGLLQKHKHLKEMKHICSLDFEPVFSPIVADYIQGMQVSVPLYSHLLNKKMSVKDIWECFSEYYKDQKMVKVLPLSDASFLPSNTYANDNKMYIFISGNDERILLTSNFDNLGKGASGAAVQCMNISCGLDDDFGL